MQHVDSFMISPNGLQSVGEDGRVRTLSNRETLSILQMDDAIPVMTEKAATSVTYTVKITAIRRRTTTPVLEARVA